MWLNFCRRSCSLSLPVECLIKQISHLCGHFDKEVTEDDFRLIALDKTRGPKVYCSFEGRSQEYFHCSHLPLKGRPILLVYWQKAEQPLIFIKSCLWLHKRWLRSLLVWSSLTASCRSHAAHTFVESMLFEQQWLLPSRLSVCPCWLMFACICKLKQLCAVHCLQSAHILPVLVITCPALCVMCPVWALALCWDNMYICRWGMLSFYGLIIIQAGYQPVYWAPFKNGF